MSADLRAETLRQRIESLDEAHGVPVSASIGVAAVSQTASGTADAIPLADAALYAGKQAGKNRVVCAERRAGKEESQPRLVV
jgi:GGDEF domain-containing protein